MGWLTLWNADVCLVLQHRAGCVGDIDDDGVLAGVSTDKAQGEDGEAFFEGVFGDIVRDFDVEL